MAKKKKKKINKSAEIRAYLAAHPGVKLSDAAAALNNKGIKVSAAYISVIKSAAKKKAAKKTERPRKAVESSSTVSLDSLLKAKKLVRELGGIDEAKRALDALAKLIE